MTKRLIRSEIIDLIIKISCDLDKKQLTLLYQIIKDFENETIIDEK